MSKSKDTITRLIDQKDVQKCKHQFQSRHFQFKPLKNLIQGFESFIFPPEREKLWNVLDDGLQRYLKVLREREQLENDCEFLRKQNQELNHMLQKFVPESFN